MGILAVDSIKSRTVAPVTVSDDLNVTGVSTVGVLTATSIVVGSAVTANSSGIIAGLVTATTFSGAFSGTTGTFSGDVSIGGTLTYEDVERVDATGLSTFREGLNVGSPTGVGGTFDPAGGLSAGIGSFSSDLNIADKIVHLGDTDTTIRFPSANTITAETGGSERVRITSSGDVGINTTVPLRPLHIVGNDGSSGATPGNSDSTMVLDNAGTNGAMIEFLNANNGAGRIMFTDTDGTNRGRMEYVHNGDYLRFDTGDYLRFDTAGSERLRITSTGGVTFSNGELVEKCYINSTAWSTTGTVDLDNGMVQYNSANLAGTTNTLDIISSAGINTTMATGDMMSVTCITAVNAATAYVDNITIDGIAATESWVGGSAPSDGGSSGVDTYAFNIIKTGSATFVVVANQVKTS